MMWRYLTTYFSMSAQEGHNDFSCTPRCPQWPHLYWSYEATYTLKCFLSEIIAKNRFFHCERWKISFSRFSRKVSILGYKLLHKFNINVDIANILVYQKSLYDLPGPSCKNIKKESGRGQKRAWFLEMSHCRSSLPEWNWLFRVQWSELRWEILPMTGCEQDFTGMPD